MAPSPRSSTSPAFVGLSHGIATRVAVAGGIAVSCGAVTAFALTPLIDTGYSAALVTLTAAGVVSTAVYVAVAHLLRLAELRQLVAAGLAGIRTS